MKNALLALALAAGLSPSIHAEAAGDSLRVCADPNNLPYSNEAGEGFENALARLVAADMGKRVAYTWWPERENFLSKTLQAGDCDVVMSVPAGLGEIATTRPYYVSSYVYLSRKDRKLDITTLTDPRLKSLRIGVQVIGADDGSNSPPAHVLGDEGISGNVTGFMIYGDTSDRDHQAEIVRAVVDGRIDIAAMWGPAAGYYAKKAPVPLAVVPIADTERFRPLQFRYAIAMGVRAEDAALRDRLNDVIERHEADIRELLGAYGFPLVDTEESDDSR